MLDFHHLAEFSRHNCIGICAFLIPANLLATLLTIILAVIGRSNFQVFLAAIVASIFAAFMMLHVHSWSIVGVVMSPTYILSGLAITCLLANVTAIIWPKRQLPTSTVSHNV
ncbi:hypothetical protein ACQFX9_27055 [Aliinostoc sp. HNIBRCY26]|uniref:hypothetical protein n=1 Tax=Aliinostoc sp. HNIBRCY26 TaxID=3418997 RepID=UPI003D036544